VKALRKSRRAKIDSSGVGVKVRVKDGVREGITMVGVMVDVAEGVGVAGMKVAVGEGVFVGVCDGVGVPITAMTA